MRRHPITALITLSWLALALPAWSADRAAASRYYEEAASLVHRKVYVDAVIQLKNALQQDPDFLPARVLLGQIYVDVGLPEPAEKELLKARAMGADAALVAPLLARAYLDQGKYQELLAGVRATGLTGATRAEVLAYRGQAHMELRDLPAAEADYAEARRLDPDSLQAGLGEATLRLRQARLAEARALSERILAAHPDAASAWAMRASVAHAQGHLDEAATGYARAIELDPRQVEARISRIGVLLDLNQDSLAATELEALRKEFPEDPRGAYLASVVRSRAGQVAEARSALEETASLLDGIPPEALGRSQQLLLLAGLVNHDLGRVEKAQAALQRYLVGDPGSIGARKLLASTLLARGAAEDAVQTLEPVRQRATRDPEFLLLLGTAYMQKGLHASAIQALEAAATLSGSDARVRTQLALSRLAAGERATAITELDSIFAKDPQQGRAGLALAILHLKRGQNAEAAEVARRLLARESKNLTVLSLLATAELQAGRYAQARAALEQMLAIDPQMLPAKLGLARVELAEGRAEDARKRLQAILAKDRTNAQAMFELARLEAAQGRGDEAERWLEKARGASPTHLPSRLALAEGHLRAGRSDKAREVAREAEAVAPDDLDTLFLAARADAAGGKADLARSTLRRMSDVAGFDGGWLLRIAGLQATTGALDEAAWSLRKALTKDPDSVPARAALAEVLLAAGDLKQASDEADLVRGRHPELAVGYRLTGDLRMREQRHAEAGAMYRAALGREKRLDLVLRLAAAERAAGAPERALAAVRDWVNANPKDRVGRHALAEAALREGDVDTAQIHYEAVLLEEPDNVAVLNNLAYLLSRKGDPHARALAERAQRLAPDDPAVNDTLGWILVQQGEAEAALPFLRAAQARKANDPEIRYHLAAALVALGRSEEARRELEAALRSATQFTDMREAQALLSRLQTVPGGLFPPDPARPAAHSGPPPMQP